MKKAKHDDIDIERITETAKQYPAELVKAIVLAAPLQAQIQQKIRKRKRQSNKRQSSSITDSICEEIEQPGFAAFEARRVSSDLVLEPLSKLARTKALPGYDDARLSAEKAMQRIYASTDAARAGREGDPWLGVCLYKVRAGLIKSNSPEVLTCFQHAQRIGQEQWFIKRLAAEVENAKKRVPGAPEFSEYRARLTGFWMHAGFWLMSDNVIARLTYVSRQAVAKAVKELKLVKHPDTARAPIIKGLDEKGRFVFRPGYPLTG